MSIRHGSNVGQPVTRQDGVMKVTGGALYAADKHVDGMLYGLSVPSPIANGTLTALDLAAARAVAGVVDVLSPFDPPVLIGDPMAKPDSHTFRLHLLQTCEVTYPGQTIAYVVADTPEVALEAARALAPKFDVREAKVGFDAGEPFVPETVGPGMPSQVGKGDVGAALAGSTRVVEETYETPAHFHNAMEPHAALAEWRGDNLHLDIPSQAMNAMRKRISDLLGHPVDKIHVTSRYVGGGFGGKAFITDAQILTAIAAKKTGRAVKFAFPRDQLFGPTGHRAPTRQTFRLGMNADGHLSAIDHHTRTTSSTFDEFFEPTGTASRTIYAVDAMKNGHEVVRVNSSTPMFLRGPGEASGSIAFESAIDEAALAADVDPLEFRLLNYAETDPLTDKPFSSKALKECYQQGGDRFGWGKRTPAPGSMRDASGKLVGYGVGSAHFPALMFAAEARATLRSDGTATFEVGAHDMGQGISTALLQIASETLDLGMDRIDVHYGTSQQPNAGMGGGSAHTSTTGTAVVNAGKDIVAQLAAIASADPASPLFGAGNTKLVAYDGRLCREDDLAIGESFVDILQRSDMSELVGTGQGGPDPMAQQKFAMYSHGAVFAEVTVDPDLYQMRVTRLIGAFAIGRVINPRLVESQLLGGMIWGLSFALHEAASIDTRTGRVTNANLAEYRLPVNADVPSIEAFTVDEVDQHINPLGMKGAGEIGITGTGGAIANAIWHATGKRIRKFPITVSSFFD